MRLRRDHPRGRDHRRSGARRGRPASILQVNLLAQVPILMAARRSGVGRIINLSSAAAYGAAALRNALLDEETACDPVSLYAISKYASEKVAARLAASVAIRYRQRPAERRVRAMGAGNRDCATRPARRCRSWRPCSSEARRFCPAPASGTGFMRLTSPTPWRCWSRRPNPNMASTISRPGVNGRRCNGDRISLPSITAWVCRLAEPGEAPTIELFSEADRAPLSVARLEQEFGWRARFGCVEFRDRSEQLVGASWGRNVTCG